MHPLRRCLILSVTLLILAGLAGPLSANALPVNVQEAGAQTIFPSDQNQADQPAADQSQAGPAGFLKGSLLGKILFGHPFERASLIDIAAILLLAFIISKIISRPGRGGLFGGGSDEDEDWPHEDKKSGPAAPPPGFDPWARLRSNQAKKPKKGKTIPFPGTKPPQEDRLPSAYSQDSAEAQMEQYPDDDEFLKGAKMIYVRLHEAWKKQDLEFIEHFTAPHVFQQYQQMDKNDYLDIVKVDARVLKEGRRNGDPFITVEFEALAHKPEHAGPPLEVREVWAFLEPANTGSWRLEEKQ